jgi:hypothetical protein
MSTLLAQIAPQRSTQYSALASALAPTELRLSPIGSHITTLEPIRLGGVDYLRCEIDQALTASQAEALGTLAMTSAFFDLFDRVGEVDGPLLRPIETNFKPDFPPDLATARRYRGKTNEAFTYFMLNVARFSSGFAAEPWQALRVFDPLMGGGTTLFAALVLGADAMGVEQSKEDVESTATFIEQYTREQGIACAAKEERLKKYGRRWYFTLDSERPDRVEGSRKQCVLARGDTAQSAELMHGVKRPHLIVTDLPYGIQHHGRPGHRGELASLLADALPVWAGMLLPGGAMAMAWESTRFPRHDMIELAQSVAQLQVLNDPPYDQMVHRVDRVIKHRDVLVATSPQPSPKEDGA